jgi:hypothetical protein
LEELVNLRVSQLAVTSLPAAKALANPFRSLTGQITVLTLSSVAFAYYAAFFLGTARPNLVSKYLGYSLLGLSLIACLSIFVYTVTLLLSGERQPFPKVWKKACTYIGPQALIEKVLPILMVFAFLGAFTQMKALIPSVQPFAWDAVFSEVDRFIFGIDPWRLTHAIIDGPATRVLDAIYLTWFPVFTCVIVYHAAFAPAEDRRKFFLSFYCAWLILGILAATLFSSAGPCFLELIGSPTSQHYAGLFPTAPSSQRVMNYLAKTYINGDLGVGTGISAMPSLHVAMAFLYVLMARTRVMKFSSAIYCAIIFVSSVHLGWHYAIDGIVAVAGMFMIYAVVARRSRPHPAPLEANVLVLPHNSAHGDTRIGSRLDITGLRCRANTSPANQ